MFWNVLEESGSDLVRVEVAVGARPALAARRCLAGEHAPPAQHLCVCGVCVCGACVCVCVVCVCVCACVYVCALLLSGFAPAATNACRAVHGLGSVAQGEQ